MKDEIKEILELLKEDLYIPQEDNREYKLLDKGDDKLLLNYITNLQESEAYYYGQYNDYKSRNEKASDFIKEKISSTQGIINDYMYHKEHNKILIELLREDIEMYKKELNILQGSDKE